MKAKALMAQTHPSEYLIHKYWARKPSNIIRGYIDSLFKKGDILVDPFCGSGVFLAEARKKDINAVGYDINPIAYLLSEVTSNPPAIEKFSTEARKIIDIANSYKNLFTIEGKDIRYVVHEVESKCTKCDKIGSISKSEKIGTKYYCLHCKNRLSFNFEKFNGTKIIKIYDRDNIEYSDQKYLKEQEKILDQIHKPKFNKDLILNRRILAFPGMKLSDLFTPRAFLIFSELFSEAHKIKDKSVQNALLLFLTSSVAQSSRLIPYRNNLSTGGPAWTVPGFWIAPLHLETNPIIHLEARYKKFLKGLESLDKQYKNVSAKVTVENIPAQTGLKNMEDNSVDGIFFDPPYGDNVPYVEFSAIWNGFLNHDINYKDEIIVSDRKEHLSSWDKYSTDIESTISLFHQKLKKSGKIVITFNNLDPRAWKIVLESFAKFSFTCMDAKYQIPAVISSKSQMASNTSYIGDYYCVFEKTKHNNKPNHDPFFLTKKIKEVLFSRKGMVPKNLIMRIIILTILNENMDLNLLGKIDDIVKPIATEDKEYYYLREELVDKEQTEIFNIENTIMNIAEKQLRDGKQSIQDLYEKILEATDQIGSPLLSETKEILKGKVFFDKNYCYLQEINRTKTLFD